MQAYFFRSVLCGLDTVKLLLSLLLLNWILLKNQQAILRTGFPIFFLGGGGELRGECSQLDIRNTILGISNTTFT